MAVRLWVFVPLFGAAALFGVISGQAAWLAVGVALWTILEYAMHRFAFHGFAPHYQHHAETRDPVFLLAPLWLSLSMAGALWALLWLTSGSMARAAATVAGVIAGYLVYELVHLRIHSTRPGGAALRFLRKHHFYHHFADEHVCYGVTSPLWDIVFRSAPKANVR